MSNQFMHGQITPRRNCERQYLSARANLLLVIIATAVNLLLLVSNSDLYFLFSASIPYYIVTMGMYLCGRFPADAYGESGAELIFLDNSVFIITLVVAVILILLYLLAWFMSNKNRVGWLTFALVLFGLDTAGLLLIYGLSFDMVLDILFHAWVLYYLVVGIKAHRKLQYLPLESDTGSTFNVETNLDGDGNADNNGETQNGTTNFQDSPILRAADMSVKHKVLLQATCQNLDICYRRVHHTNELVINGNVYADKTGVIEINHVLYAEISGHVVTAGLERSYSFITVDGVTIAQKLRLI